MSSQFPAAPVEATRLLLILDAAIDSDAADDLAALVAGYTPAVVAAENEVVSASRLIRGTDALLHLDPHLGTDGDEALNAIRTLLAAHPGGCVAVVIGDSGARALLCEALGVPLAAAWRFQIEAGAVTVIEIGPDGRWALLRFNERAAAAQT